MIKVNGTELTPDNFKELLNPKQLNAMQLVDILGDVKAEATFLKKVDGYMKELIAATQDEDEFEFEASRFFVTRVSKARFGLSKDLVLEDMGEEWVDNHSTTTDYFEMRIKPIKE